MSEEETFCIMVKLMSDYRLRELFKPNMTELGLCMYQLECLLQVSQAALASFVIPHLSVEYPRSIPWRAVECDRNDLNIVSSIL